MIHALISGALFRSPEQRTAKTGKPFVTATVKIKDGESSIFVKIFAFSESVQAELLRLSDGDAVAVQGSLKIEQYIAVAGATKVSLSIVAEQILAVKQEPKKRAAKTPAPPLIPAPNRRASAAIGPAPKTSPPTTFRFKGRADAGSSSIPPQ
jgi:single-stranded DNA-binding protein